MATPEAPKLNYTDEMGVRREAPVSKRKHNSQRVTPKRGAISESRVNSTASKNKIPFNHEKVSAPAQSNPTPQFANEMKASGFVSAPAQSSPTPSRDRAAFIVSIIGVALLSVYTTITALQWHSMQQSLELTRKSIQARERPWIGFADMQVVSSDRRPITLTADAEVFALATIKNSGPLPAFELKARGNWLRTNTGFPDTPPYPEETWPKQQSQAVLGASDILIHPVLVQKQSTSEMDAINKGTMNLYVYGHITYRDPFRVPHELKFCQVYVPKTGTWTLCENYNFVD